MSHSCVCESMACSGLHKESAIHAADVTSVHMQAVPWLPWTDWAGASAAPWALSQRAKPPMWQVCSCFIALIKPCGATCRAGDELLQMGHRVRDSDKHTACQASPVSGV